LRAQYFGGSRGNSGPRIMLPHESLEWLGDAILGSAATTLTLTFPYPVGLVEGYARVAGYSAGQIMGIRLNGDSGNNYADRQFVSTSVTNVTGAARASIRCATVGITGPRSLVRFTVRKHRAGVVAAVFGWTHSDQEGSATAPLMYAFNGTWNNTSALITSVTLESGGAGTLSSNTWLGCYGARTLG